MDKATVKLLLESYRSPDAGDPIFAEALREVAADPELRAWFEEMQRFDAVMVAKFREVSVPPEVKNHVLLGYHNAGAASRSTESTPFSHRSAAAKWIGAMAASLVLGLIGWRWFFPPARPEDALALQAISYTEQMPALQFVCFDPAAVASWVNEQPGTQQLGIQLPMPDKSMSMAMIGSSIVDWNHQPVIMICLQNGRRMAMLYILKSSDTAAIREGAVETMQKGEWTVRTTKSGGRVRVLAAKNRPDESEFQIPF